MSTLKFIQVTDIHLISGARRLYGVSPESRLHAAIDSINQEHGDADFVVFSGDLVHWGVEENYTVFFDAVGRLTMPVKLMVGNHDDTQALAKAAPDIPIDEHGFVQYVEETPVGRCLFLDTHRKDSDAGEYCPVRLAWLKGELEGSSGPVLIFMHHPPMKVGMKGMDTLNVLENEAFFSVVQPTWRVSATCSSAMFTGRFSAIGAASPFPACAA